MCKAVKRSVAKTCSFRQKGSPSHRVDPRCPVSLSEMLLIIPLNHVTNVANGGICPKNLLNHRYLSWLTGHIYALETLWRQFVSATWHHFVGCRCECASDAGVRWFNDGF